MGDSTTPQHVVKKTVKANAVRLRFQTFNAFVDHGASELKLSASASLTWVVLYRHACPKGNVSIPASRIMASFNLSRRSVTNAIKELRDAKLLMVVRKGSVQGVPAAYRIRPRDFERFDPKP